MSKQKSKSKGKIDIKKFKKNKKVLLIFGISILSLLMLLSVIMGVIQYRQLSEKKEAIIPIAEKMQLSLHREMNILNRIESLDNVSNFKEKCEEFSFGCLEMGLGIRNDFFIMIESQTFSDKEIEVVNMFSSIDEGVRRDIEEYEGMALEYNQGLKKFPIIFLSPFLRITSNLSD